MLQETTYLQLIWIVVQSTTALNLTIEQHPPLIHHFYRRDVILIRENGKRKQHYVYEITCEKKNMKAEDTQQYPRKNPNVPYPPP